MLTTKDRLARGIGIGIDLFYLALAIEYLTGGI